MCGGIKIGKEKGTSYSEYTLFRCCFTTFRDGERKSFCKLSRPIEKAFVNYQDQSKKLLEVFQYFQKLNIKLKAEKDKKERVHILKN